MLDPRKMRPTDLSKDPGEKKNLFGPNDDTAKRMVGLLKAFNDSVDRSIAGQDYPEGRVVPADPGPKTWMQLDEYQPYLEGWKDRPEFKRYIKLDQ